MDIPRLLAAMDKYYCFHYSFTNTGTISSWSKSDFNLEKSLLKSAAGGCKNTAAVLALAVCLNLRKFGAHHISHVNWVAEQL
jgi:hypothetical protein